MQFPVFRPQFFAGDLTFKVALQSKAVVRRKWTKTMGPCPDVASVAVPEQTGHLSMASSEGENF